jgi:hypothetical protein
MLKTRINPASPMTSGRPSRSAKLCGANTRFGPCQEACEPGRRRCRLHGGAPGSGAPHGARNGRYVSGKHTKEAKAERRWVRSILGSVTGNDAMQEASPLELVDDRAPAPTASQPARRVSAQVYQSGGAGEFSARPPAGETRKDWLVKLRKALGSRSGPFIEASLHRLLAACTLPGHHLPTSISVSAALALIESMEPQNEIEAIVAVDMACLYAACGSMLGRLARHSVPSNAASTAGAVAKLERAFHSSVALYHRLKHGNRQTIRIERLEIQSGAQAVVGQLVAR